MPVVKTTTTTTTTTTTSTIQLRDLSRRQLSEIRRRASTRGITPEQYIKRLIEDDLSNGRRVRRKSLFELAEPVRDALKDYTDEELDALVDSARGPRHRKR
jgi:hypothetical protein